MFEPTNPDYARQVRASFARQAFMAHIGAELADVSPGACEIHLPHRPEITQQHGYVHGGAVGAIIDSAMGYASYSLAPAGSSVLTVEYKINLLAPGDGERLVARGRVGAHAHRLPGRGVRNQRRRRDPVRHRPADPDDPRGARRRAALIAGGWRARGL